MAKTPRRIAFYFPDTKEGDFLEKCLEVTARQEGRTMSSVVYTVLLDYFYGTSEEFQNFIWEQVEESSRQDHLHSSQ